MKFFLGIMPIILLLAGCKKQDVELVTINVSVYVDNNRVAANFALVDPNQYYVVNSEHTVDKYLTSIPVHAQFLKTNFSEQVISGEYILVVQLKDGGYGTLPGTYSYTYITTRGTPIKTNYTLQLSKTKQSLYQPWIEKK